MENIKSLTDVCCHRIYFLLFITKMASVAFCYYIILKEKVMERWFSNSNYISLLTYSHKWVQKFSSGFRHQAQHYSICIFLGHTKVFLFVPGKKNVSGVVWCPNIHIFLHFTFTLSISNGDICLEAVISLAWLHTNILITIWCLEFYC